MPVSALGVHEYCLAMFEVRMTYHQTKNACFRYRFYGPVTPKLRDLRSCENPYQPINNQLAEYFLSG